MSDSFLEQAFVFPESNAQRVLVIGLGGGCDILTAYAVAQHFCYSRFSDVVLANTKTEVPDSLTPVTKHIFRFAKPYSERSHRGKLWIDESIPRFNDQSPLIVTLPKSSNDSEIVDEISSLGFELIIGVDTGGDSIAKKGKKLGRDQRMMKILNAICVPLLQMVIALGSDGETTAYELREATSKRIEISSYQGCFDLAPFLPFFEGYHERLSPNRTPNLILQAYQDQLEDESEGVKIPRGRFPVIPNIWLRRGLVFWD